MDSMLTPSIRQSIRKSVGIRSTGVTVTIIPGNHRPKLWGEPGGWFTRGGKPIRYPSAYSKVGFSNMVYQCSTENITVGKQWLKRNLVVRNP